MEANQRTNGGFKELRNKMISKEEIEKHVRLTKEVKDYINECLDAKDTPPMILESFQKFIDEIIKERLEKDKKK